MLHEPVQVGPGRLPGELIVPDGASGLVLFAHGSGSSRLSPRNRFVAGSLHGRGLGTLLFDLLSEAEARNRVNVFEIRLLGERLDRPSPGSAPAPTWPRCRSGCSAPAPAPRRPLAAAERPGEVAAVVSRGGRPDLAGAARPRVRAPTLLIVGGADTEVLALNRQAFAHLDCEKRLDVVPGATHLFDEPGTLERVAELAREWFASHARAPHPAA